MSGNEIPDRVPFGKPDIGARELDYVTTAIENSHTSASGPFSQRVVDLLKESHDAADVLLTTSCTDALEMSAMLLELGPGDTVIVPSFTFTSTALAFARQGANIRFCDIEPSLLGIDPDHVEHLLDDSVRAVVPVHYAGVGCEMARLAGVLDGRPDISIVEDNAHGLFGSLDGRTLGSFGRCSTLSFHETKNFTCGEGGALVLNDPSDVDRAHILYDKGTNRRQFFLGQVDKYSWQDLGSSFGMSDLLAAVLLAQLEQRDRILESRATIAHHYREHLEPHAERLGFRLPVVPDDRISAHHMFYVLLSTKDTRDQVVVAMEEEGIKPAFHYVPLHSSAAGRRFTDRDHDCPVSQKVSDTLLRLPFFNNLTEAQVDRVCQAFLTAVSAAR